MQQADRPRLLVVVYAFPPANNVASMRGVRIGRAFATRGWDVHVLKSDFHQSPPGLEADVSHFTLHDYHPNAVSRLLAKAPSRRSAKSLLLSLGRRLVAPDHSWLMWNAVDRAIDRLGGLDQFDCVISSASPFVLHDVVRARKAKGGRFFWVADTRDMWAGSAYRHSNLVPESSLRKAERAVFGCCDLATFTSGSTARVYEERYGIDAMVVLNGFEGSIEPAQSRDRAPLRRFVHAGTLYGGHRDLSPLLRALTILSGKDREPRELILAGVDADVAAARLAPKPPVSIKVEGQLSRIAAAGLQDSADALVVATADTDFDASFTPAKLLEYAFRNKPIIATAREESDVGRLIERHDLGIASFEPSRIESFIERVESGEWKGPRDLIQLTSDFQFGRLAGVVDQRASASSAC